MHRPSIGEKNLCRSGYITIKSILAIDKSSISLKENTLPVTIRNALIEAISPVHLFEMHISHSFKCRMACHFMTAIERRDASFHWQ